MARQLDDWVAETPESIAARLEGAKTAQKQTRFTLGMMALISMMLLISTYNAYLSFDSGWVLARTSRPLQDGNTPRTVADVLTNQALQDWAASRNVMISLLGIRVSVDDAPVLGTISLFLFSLWLLLVTRRENHTVGSLLRDTDSPLHEDESQPAESEPTRPERPDLYTDGQRWLIFHTVVANSLFVTFDRSLSPVRSLHGPNSLTGRRVKGVKGVLSRVTLEFARGFFFLFPVVVSALVFYLDRRSYFEPDPFAPGAAIPGTSAPFFFESTAVFLACWIPLLACCTGSGRYLRATDSVLREYGNRLQSDLSHRADVAPERDYVEERRRLGGGSTASTASR